MQAFAMRFPCKLAKTFQSGLGLTGAYHLGFSKSDELYYNLKSVKGLYKGLDSRGLSGFLRGILNALNIARMFLGI